MSSKAIEERQPVLVGAGQWSQRDASLEEALDPLAMLERVAKTAAQSAGLPAGALADLDSIGIVSILAWQVANAPDLLAERLGAQPGRKVQTVLGGEMGCRLINELATEIAAGRSKMALAAGCNNVRTLRKARDAKCRLDWPSGGQGELETLGADSVGTSELENRYGLQLPPSIYPIFGNALRAHQGLSLDAHRKVMGAMMSDFTRVAAGNPHAWFPVERQADDITSATASNRMVAFPYTKYLNAILETDQGAAVLVISAAEARRRGIPEDRWVYWRGGSNKNEDVWFFSQRPRLYASEGMRGSAQGALRAAGLGLEDVDHFDFYSCFPSAVEVACEMMGLAPDDPRGFTVTGGLPYAGGPGNNYTLHSMAAMVDRLRAPAASESEVGLVTGNGWYLTKHSATVLSREGPQAAPAAGEPVESTNAEQAFPVLEEARGNAKVDGYTVLYARDGTPETGVVIARLESGERFLAHTPPDRDLLETFVAREQVGAEGSVSFVEGMNRFEPR